MECDFIGFIGFGLIGGSLARAIKEKHAQTKILVFDHHSEGPNETLELAKSESTIDQITHTLSDFSECDIIFLCAPVKTNINYLTLLRSIIKPTCILTDVGSVKGEIHRAVEDLMLTQNFIGGHPMAGSEKTGYENSSSRLFENAYYIITPTKDSTPEDVNFMRQLVTEISAIPIILDYEDHDDITAAISHIPHIIAANLVNLIRENDDEEGRMRLLAAGGFKDITRIASSSPAMWESICMSNTRSILKFLQKYIASLERTYKELAFSEEHFIYDLFENANEYRSTIANHIGLIDNIYDIYLDITDETGAIATVAALLASHNISIKNIGIVHNREFSQGVLRIETYKAADRENALALLVQNKYTVYNR